MIYGILRIFRNSERGYNPNVVEIVKKWLNIGVDHILAVVSDPLDKENTDQAIRDAFLNNERVSVIRIKSYRALDYWATAINEGIRYLAAKFEINKNDGLLIFSNEASITDGIFRTMKGFLDMREVSVVGVKFPGFTGKSYDEIPRNTCALWNFAELLLLGGFSAECDTTGGMEDYLMIKVLQSKGRGYMIIDSQEEVMLTVISPKYQKAKVVTELKAMRAIDKMLKDRGFPP